MNLDDAINESTEYKEEIPITKIKNNNIKMEIDEAKVHWLYESFWEKLFYY